MSALLNAHGGLAAVRLAGKALAGELSELVIGTPSIDLQQDQVAQLPLTFHDDGFRLLSSGIFAVGTTVSYLDLTFRIAAVETGGGRTEQVTIVCRSAHARKLREDRSPLVLRNVSPTEYLALRCRELGLTFLGQPSAKRTQVGRLAPAEDAAGEPESDWDVGVRTAEELGYVFGEDGTGSVYFGKPTWLATSAKRWAARWPKPGTQVATELELSAVPQARRSEDAEAGATLALSALPYPAEGVRPFHALDLYGVPGFVGRYLVTSVKLSLTAAATVAVDAEWPDDPEPADG